MGAEFHSFVLKFGREIGLAVGIPNMIKENDIDGHLINYARLMTCCQNSLNGLKFTARELKINWSTHWSGHLTLGTSL